MMTPRLSLCDLFAPIIISIVVHWAQDDPWGEFSQRLGVVMPLALVALAVGRAIRGTP